MLFRRLKRWHQQWLLHRYRIPIRLWRQVIDDTLSHYHLDRKELHQLRKLASLFLQRKTINGAGGLEITDYICAVVAGQACLLILKLDLDYYDGWQEIIIYPDSFVVAHKQVDAIGLVHEKRAVLGGEAWENGPLILSWNTANPSHHSHSGGSNVILHEFAHKLDMLNGTANGMPPLHSTMNHERWTEVLSHDYAQLLYQLRHRHNPTLDKYAAESPAEFFAVATELFFQSPQRLHKHLPLLYQQLSLFYRQDPRRRQVNKLLR